MSWPRMTLKTCMKWHAAWAGIRFSARRLVLSFDNSCASFIVTKFANVIASAFTACFPQVALVAVPHPSGLECCSMLPVRNEKKAPREKPNMSDPPFTHWKRSFSNITPNHTQWHMQHQCHHHVQWLAAPGVMAAWWLQTGTRWKRPWHPPIVVLLWCTDLATTTYFFPRQSSLKSSSSSLGI